jgi:(p)ppGpp synthase/HD superfamily hydrolase
VFDDCFIKNMQLTDRFTDALVYAAQLHATQVRKGSGVPYVAHLLGVASLVLEYGGDEAEAIAALLHDAIEDCGGAAIREEIRHKFGDRVTEIVDGCTDTDITPKPPWRARKEAYIAHIPTASSSIRLVSVADKLYNARSILKDYQAIGEEIWNRFAGRKDGSLWYYRACVEAFRQAVRAAHPQDKTHPLVEELDRIVSELENL